jgi:hypothetical protein
MIKIVTGIISFIISAVIVMSILYFLFKVAAALLWYIGAILFGFVVVSIAVKILLRYSKAV